MVPGQEAVGQQVGRVAFDQTQAEQTRRVLQHLQNGTVALGLLCILLQLASKRKGKEEEEDIRLRMIKNSSYWPEISQVVVFEQNVMRYHTSGTSSCFRYLFISFMRFFFYYLFLLLFAFLTERSFPS